MTTDIWTDAILSEMPDEQLEEFEEIVLQDVKNKLTDKNLKTILYNNTDLWLYCLQVLRKEIELQLTNYKSTVKSKIREMREQGCSQEQIDEIILVDQRWRSNALKFLLSVEKRMLYVKLLQTEDDSTE